MIIVCLVNNLNLNMSQRRKPKPDTSSLQDYDLHDSFDEDWEEDDDVLSASSKSKAGRKKVPEQWSRVICIAKDDLTNLKTYDLATDLLFSNGMKYTPPRGKQLPDWKPIFWPDQYCKEGHSLRIADN